MPHCIFSHAALHASSHTLCSVIAGHLTVTLIFFDRSLISHHRRQIALDIFHSDSSHPPTFDTKLTLMPSFNIGTIIVIWYHAGDCSTAERVRYPWCYPAFRTAIGYPVEDGFTATYDPFAPGATNTIPCFSDDDFLRVQAYIQAFGRIGKQGSSREVVGESLNALYHKFSMKKKTDAHNRARDLITKLGTKLWWNKNAFNDSIDRALKQEGIHPLQLHAQLPSALTSKLEPTQRQRMKMLDVLAPILFGDEIYSDSPEYPEAMEAGLKEILHIIINRFRKRKNRIANKYSQVKGKADTSMQGSESSVLISKVPYVDYFFRDP
jgi:hypothetical protein